MKKLQHVAFLLKGHKEWSKGRYSAHDLYAKVFAHTKDILHWQVKFHIPIVTINLLSDQVLEHESFGDIVLALADYCDSLLRDEFVFSQKVKISIFGKWYDLPSKVVERVKQVIDETKDFDQYFFNICIHYNCKQELVDAAKIVALKVLSGRLTMNSINEDTIKDTIYSSSFLPPDIIIKTGNTHRLYGFMMWDATHAHIHFSHKPWLGFTEKDLQKAIAEWEKVTR